MNRYLPITAIAAAFVVVLLVVVTSGDGGNRAVQRNAAAGQSGPRTKPTPGPDGRATTQPTGPTAKVNGPHRDAVPILMYHVTKAAPAGTPYPELWVSPKDFSGQMDWLDHHGFTGVTMQQLFDYWRDGHVLPPKPIVISFDDGYPSHDKYARPILARHKWPGELFLELKNVGNPDSGFTSSMVRDLIRSGWEIDSHTVNHLDLPTASAQQLKFELEASRARIKRDYGVPANFFCYPAGKYNAAVVAAVKRAGYMGATTVDEGLGEKAQAYTLKRIRIDGTDGVTGFASKLQAAGA
jgi:peptidoglycan/xylan/chitin deacetylase (PgdA/CDA1 family)